MVMYHESVHIRTFSWYTPLVGTNLYGFVPTLRDSGRAGPDAARRAPR